MEPLLFALAIVAYLVTGLVAPALSVWRRHGIWPVVFTREAAPGQRILGALCAALLVGLAMLGVLHATVGPDALGVWSLPAPARAVGWLLMAVGGVVTVAAQRRMGASWRVGIDERPTPLVTDGLFSVVRNPIFSGLLAFLAGVTVLSPAWWSVVVLVATGLAIRLQVRREEEHLRRLHGAAYLAYASRVGRFTPLTGKLRPPPTATLACRSTSASRGSVRCD